MPISIAVLPFVNMSTSGENEFFCDGITEEIIHAMARIEQLKVISRSSSFFYKNHQSSIREIAQNLGVSVILEGSVRVGGDMMRITAQLVEAEEDSPFWSDSWDRPRQNVFEVQDEISLLIAEKLREQMGHLEISEHLVEQATQSLDAYELYLEGRFHANKWNPADVNHAIGLFEKALEIDPNLLDANLGLADCYSFLAVAGFAPRDAAWAKAVEALDQVKKQDPDNAGLNYLMANHAFFTEADFAAALAFTLKALASSPTYPDAQRFASFFYALKGDFPKAQEHMLFVKSIDPLNPETRFFEAYYHYRTENYPKAFDILTDLLEENPQNLPAIISRTNILILQNRWSEAKAELEQIPEELIARDERLGLACLIEARETGQRPESMAELEVHGQSAHAHHAHSYLFMNYVALGKLDEAFQVLKKLSEEQSSILFLSFGDPLVKAIREDDRYPVFHKRLFPEQTARKNSLKKTVPPPFDEAYAARVTNKLEQYIEIENPHLNPSLTLRSLAEQIDVHPNKLSWLLNEYIGKNFNEFVNRLRVEHFKKLVLDPSNSHISLLGLAFESGFNSKTAFNTAFKKETGMTPKAFQKSRA